MYALNEESVLFMASQINYLLFIIFYYFSVVVNFHELDMKKTVLDGLTCFYYREYYSQE